MEVRYSARQSFRLVLVFYCDIQLHNGISVKDRGRGLTLIGVVSLFLTAVTCHSTLVLGFSATFLGEGSAGGRLFPHFFI